MSAAGVGGQAADLDILGMAKTFHTDQGPVVALGGVDVRVRSGEFVSIIGPSGCGKSTLFNVVAGLLTPDAGEVRIGGRTPERLLGRTAYMPQHDALFAWRRIVDNVILGLQVAGVSRKEARRQAEPLLERFGLGRFSQSYPRELSGGMRQRAAFLRTVLMQRPVMLLDEPFGALDSITRSDMQQWLLEVWQEVGTTVLFITHDVSEAVFLSDRVYVMSARPGRIVSEVEIDLPRPRTLAVEEDPRFGTLELRLRRELRAGLGSSTARPSPTGST